MFSLPSALTVESIAAAAHDLNISATALKNAYSESFAAKALDAVISPFKSAYAFVADRLSGKTSADNARLETSKRNQPELAAKVKGAQNLEHAKARQEAVLNKTNQFVVKQGKDAAFNQTFSSDGTGKYVLNQGKTYAQDGVEYLDGSRFEKTDGGLRIVSGQGKIETPVNVGNGLAIKDGVFNFENGQINSLASGKLILGNTECSIEKIILGKTADGLEVKYALVKTSEGKKLCYEGGEVWDMTRFGKAITETKTAVKGYEKETIAGMCNNLLINENDIGKIDVNNTLVKDEKQLLVEMKSLVKKYETMAAKKDYHELAKLKASLEKCSAKFNEKAAQKVEIKNAINGLTTSLAERKELVKELASRGKTFEDLKDPKKASQQALKNPVETNSKIFVAIINNLQMEKV